VFKKVWKIYFFVFIVISIFDLLFKLWWSNFQPNWNDLIIICVFELIAIIGLYGFVYHKQIVKPGFWKLIFIISIVFVARGVYDDIQFYGTIDKNLYNSSDQFLGIIIDIVVLAPFLIAMFMYAFKSHELWDK